MQAGTADVLIQSPISWPFTVGRNTTATSCKAIDWFMQVDR